MSSPPGSSCPGKNTGEDSHSLLHEIFPTQELTWVSGAAGRFFTVWATWDSIVTGGHGLKLVGDAVGEVWHRPREKNLALGLEDLSLNLVAILLCYPELRNLCKPSFSSSGTHMKQLEDNDLWFGEGNGTPLQYSCLENPMDGAAW